jgi:16S rRNA (cytosine967-C5)-methyltransferase
MTPAARLAATMGILDELARGDAPTRDVLAGYFRRRRYAGSRDRAAIRDRVYATVRDLARLQWHLAAAGGDATRPRHWVLAACALAGEPVAALFAGDGYGPPALDSGEAALAAALAVADDSDDAVPEAARLGCPAWLEPALRASLDGDFAAELRALNDPAPVDLRVNAARTDREAMRRALAAAGIAAAPTPIAPHGLRLDGHPELQDLAVLRDGLIEPQDEGSQLLALAVGAVPGDRVVDYCAGAGGKTLALAAAMTGPGGAGSRIVACDVSAARLRRMTPRLARAGAAALVEFHDLSAGDGTPLPPGTADRVLVDAPCSATGTWRRHPFQRWRLDAAALAALVALQRDILDAAATLVRPGGRLVYATCSLLDAENRTQAARFAADHPGFVRLPVDQSLPAIVRGDMVTSQGELRLTPARHGTDGVFAALFERKAA